MFFATPNEATYRYGHTAKTVCRQEVLFALVIAVLLTAPLLGLAPSECQRVQLCSQSGTLGLAETDDLPSANVTLSIIGGVLGNRVNGILEYEIVYDPDVTYYKIGFRQHFLEILDSPLTARVQGLGYDEMREYPFVYTSHGMVTDFWVNGTPSWISRRHYPAWSDTSRWGGYLGPITPENWSGLTYAGDIVEFENLTVYFNDGTSFLVGPRLITAGVNFTRTDQGWNATYLLDVSESQGVQISDTGFTITLATPEPLSLPFVGGVLTVLALGVLAVVFKRYRRRIRSKMRKPRGPSSIEPV